MTINYTTLLGLTEPVTGTQSGTWGSDINTGLTDYVEAAIAGAQVISGSQTAVTLSVTTGSSSAPTTLSQAGSGATGSSQYQIIRCTGNPAGLLTITAPASDKTYVILNATSTSQAVKIVGAGPTTGVTIVSGERAFVAWNGSDFVKVGGAAGGTNTQVQYNNGGVFGGVSGATTNGTAITFSTTNLKLQGSSTGVSSFASANSGATDYTITFPAASTTIPVATQTLTFSGPTAARTITLPDANFTAARTDSAQTFTGVQTFSSNPILSGGTANGVLYLNGSNVATTGSALTFDGTNFNTPASVVSGSIGLLYGNTYSAGNSQAWFTVNSTASDTYRVADTAMRYRLLTGVGHVWETAPSGSIGGAISWSEQMRLTSTGLGIGTSSPSYKLHVSGAGAVSSRTYATDSTGDASFFVGNNDGKLAGALVYGSTKTAYGAIGSNESAFYSNTSTTIMADGASQVIKFATGGNTERARITSGGNVGIGTSSPGALLEVLASGGSSAISARYSTGSSSLALYIYHDGTNAYIDSTAYGAGTGGPIVFRRNLSTETARITSGGDLLVATTDNSQSAGIGVKLRSIGATYVVNDGSADALSYYNTSAAAYRFYVDPTGKIYATFTTIGGISDQRLKENVQDLDVGLDSIMALKPRKFDWKVGKGKDIKGDRGFIAQEFEQVFPDLIDEWKDPAPEGEEPYKSVRQDLIPVLVKAIQEQQALITSLTARVALLEGTQP